MLSGKDRDDFSILPTSSSDAKDSREEVGAVIRGGYSQIRGKGIGIALVLKDRLKEAYEYQRAAVGDDKRFKGSGKLIMLMRNVNSLSYLPVIC